MLAEQTVGVIAAAPGGTLGSEHTGVAAAAVAAAERGVADSLVTCGAAPAAHRWASQASAAVGFHEEQKQCSYFSICHHSAVKQVEEVGAAGAEGEGQRRTQQEYTAAEVRPVSVLVGSLVFHAG